MPPVILVSGWGFSTRPMEPLAAALQPWPATLVSASELIRRATASCTTPESSLADLVSAQPEPAVVVAWSLGAMLALQALPHCHQNIRHLHLLSVTLRFLQDADSTCAQTATELAGLRRAVSRNPAVTLPLFARNAAKPNGDWLPDPIPSDWFDLDAPLLCAGLDLLKDTDLRGRTFPAVSATLIHGKEDNLMPVNASRLVAAALPGAQLNRIPGLGHLTPLYVPQIQAGMIRDATLK